MPDAPPHHTKRESVSKQNASPPLSMTGPIDTALDEVLSLLKNKESEINPYFQRFKTHEFDVEEAKVLSSSNITLQYSKYGLVQLNLHHRIKQLKLLEEE